MIGSRRASPPRSFENGRMHVARELLGLGHGAQRMTQHVVVPGQPAVARQLGTGVGRGRRIELIAGIALEAGEIVVDAASANRVADFLLRGSRSCPGPTARLGLPRLPASRVRSTLARFAIFLRS